MTYVDHLKYQECVKDPNDYVDRAKIVNFDIIHNRYREYPLTKSIREHGTIPSDDFVKYPAQVKKRIISAALRNKRQDLWVKRDLMIEHFKKVC